MEYDTMGANVKPGHEGGGWLYPSEELDEAALWKAKAEALAAELEEIDAEPQPRDIGPAIGWFLAGATAVSIIWWTTLL